MTAKSRRLKAAQRERSLSRRKKNQQDRNSEVVAPESRDENHKQERHN